MRHLRPSSTSVRAAAAGLAALGVAGIAGMAAATPLASAPATGALGLQPNHFTAPVGTKPGNGGTPGGGHGGGGSGGGGAGGGSAPVYGWASSNWSGYAVTSGAPYTSVSANWKVPSVARTKSASYSAAWVGIDGFNNSSLIQTGTEQDWYSGAAHYAAWWTTSDYGFYEQVIPDAVHAGDAMTATISKDSADTSWTMTLADHTLNWSFSQKVSYTGPDASAEWIMEAPTIGGRVAPLAAYSSPTTFDPGSANGSSPGFVAATDAGVLVQRGVIVSSPSAPDKGGDATDPADGFNMAYGPYAPPAPSS